MKFACLTAFTLAVLSLSTNSAFAKKPILVDQVTKGNCEIRTLRPFVFRADSDKSSFAYIQFTSKRKESFERVMPAGSILPILGVDQNQLVLDDADMGQVCLKEFVDAPNCGYIYRTTTANFESKSVKSLEVICH